MRPTSFRTIAVLTLIPVAGVLLFIGYVFARTGHVPISQGDLPLPTSPEVMEANAAPALPEAPKTPKHRGDIVLIIDDVGFENQPLDRAMQIDPDVNFAVLPNGNRTADFANALNRRGFEILCHLPMEPIGRESPGPGAITTSMSDEEIARATRENVAAVPHARGVNNHMGSRATADRRVMSTVLRALPDGMYFIDSKTSGRSVAWNVAREMKVRTAARHVFLDDVQSKAAIRKQLHTLAAAAEQRGVAVGIGHIYPVTVDVLREEIPNLRTRGFRLLRASDAVR